MKQKDKDARERILRATLELLQAEQDVDRVTVRQIAAAAGVNGALINYYFRSKENLLNEAVSRQMALIAERMLSPEGADGSPEDQLRAMVRAMSDFSFGSYFLSSIIIGSDLKRGSGDTCRMLVPLLRGIRPERTEQELLLLAMQVVIPLQVLFLNAEVYSRLLQEDLFDKARRDRIVDTLVDQLLKEVKQ